MRSVPSLASLLFLGACSEHLLDGPDTVNEKWLVTGDADILIFGDTSESMQDTLSQLADSVEVMIARLAEADVNWQLIAVTGPDGCAQGGVLTEETPDWADAFRAGILTPPGEDLVDEWGLHNAAAAVEASVEGGCNEGFLREDAHLHVMFISDEDDNSPGFDGPDDNYWVAYVDTLLASKADPTRVRLSAVTGPAPVGCAFADYGRGYVEAVEATQGELLSICDDWALDAGALANTSVVQSRFTLRNTPNVDTVQVFVDGLERASGWALEGGGADALTFAADVPYAGQEVSVQYEVGRY